MDQDPRWSLTFLFSPRYRLRIFEKGRIALTQNTEICRRESDKPQPFPVSPYNIASSWSRPKIDGRHKSPLPARSVGPKNKKPDAPFGAPGLFKFLTAELAKRLPCSAKCGNDSYIIPPMPWSWPWGSGASGSGMSLMRHSVVRRSPEIDAAFWRALRVTLVGSTTPPATRSS